MSDQPQPAEGQCAFYLPRKKRFCRFRPNAGQKYCPEHACVMGVALERKRIACPLNPKHTCYEDNLEKHLKKCNSRKRKTSEVYYEEGINAGSEEGDCVVNMQTAVKATDTERLRQMIDKVNRLYEEYIGTVEEDVRSHDCLRQEMDNPYFGLSALRHRRQQASLIGQLEGLGLLTPGHCYVEMGAGKGQLSHWVRQAVSSHDDAAFLLVDRSSIRYKVDGHHKEEEKVKFERIKIDIEHLCLGKVPMVAGSERPLVAMGKHLCGAATDLTLRCLMETMTTASPDASATSEEPRPKRSRTDNNDTSSGPTDHTDTGPSEKPLSAESSGLDDSSQASSRHCVDGVTPQTKLEASPELGFERKCEDFEKNRDDLGKRGEGVSDTATGDGTRSPSGQCDGEKNGSRLESDRSDCPPTGQEKDGGGNAGEGKRPEGVLIALCCHHQCGWKAYVGKGFMRQCHITPHHTAPHHTAPHHTTLHHTTPYSTPPLCFRPEGVLIALCCHHQCRWKAYVGKGFMRQCHITADDFHLLSRLTSWAVCGWRGRDGSFGTKDTAPTKTSLQDGSKGEDTSSVTESSLEQTSSQKGDDDDNEEEPEHNTTDLVGNNDKEGGLQLTEKQKERVGWRCKRLIDYGRVRYLQDRGLCSSLKIYIDARQTPENVVLVATPDKR
ncbi:hypothetical protein ACOMHN_032598 [Nucella lapillus]